jgi:hypothetical protein
MIFILSFKDNFSINSKVIMGEVLVDNIQASFTSDKYKEVQEIGPESLIVMNVKSPI